MVTPNEILVIIDYVEDETKNGKVRKRITTMAGESYQIGLNLTEKWPLLKHGQCLSLKMGIYQNSPYVDDFVPVELTPDEIAKLSLVHRNPKDASLERQTAVKFVVDLMSSGYPDLPDDLRDATFEWIRGALK